MAFDPNEPRDDHGRWTEGGGSGGGGEAGGDIPVAPDPRVATVVGGDIWNKDTAARLENEYAAARPAIDKIANEAPDHEGDVTVTHEPDWGALSGTSQEKAESEYQTQNYDSEFENEVTNWQESGEASKQAATELAEDEDWKAETLTDYLADRIDDGKGNKDMQAAYDHATAIIHDTSDKYGAMDIANAKMVINHANQISEEPSPKNKYEPAAAYEAYLAAKEKLNSGIESSETEGMKAAQKIVDAHNEEVAHGTPTTDKTPTLKTEDIKE